jgi:hypothetical protein
MEVDDQLYTLATLTLGIKDPSTYFIGGGGHQIWSGCYESRQNSLVPAWNEMQFI